jgi:hypothetical protein
MRRLPSSGEHRIQTLSYELVLGLHLRRGVFWGAVGGIRSRWGIEAEIKLPPAISRATSTCRRIIRSLPNRAARTSRSGLATWRDGKGNCVGCTIR